MEIVNSEILAYKTIAIIFIPYNYRFITLVLRESKQKGFLLQNIPTSEMYRKPFTEYEQPPRLTTTQYKSFQQ